MQNRLPIVIDHIINYEKEIFEGQGYFMWLFTDSEDENEDYQNAF